MSIEKINSSTRNYEYKGQPLQKEELYNIIVNYSSYIPCLKSSEPFQTSQLLNEIYEFHTQNGGKKDFYRTGIHKVINKLEVTHPGLLKNTKRGWYIINDKNLKAKKIISAKPNPIKKTEAQPLAKNIYREGKWFIYVLFDRKKICKIGKTNNVASRFKTYASGWSVMWDYIIEVRLENKSEMDLYEKIIHNILKIRKLEVIDTNKGGNEFFRIKPDEIKKIIEEINKTIF
jgi:hypothetical protein